jgi:protein TonB
VLASAAAAALLAVLVLLRPRAPRHPEGTARAVDTVGFVTSDGAPLRKTPSPSAETVAHLTAGSRLALKADLGEWLQASTDKGVTGFVSAEAVEKQSDQAARERRARVIAGFTPVFGLVAEDTDVRLAPFPQAPTSGRLTRGAVIPIYSVDHAFYAFKTSAGQIAFVASADVDLVPTDPSKPEIRPARQKGLKDLAVIDDSAPPPPEAEPETAEQPAVPAPPAPAAPAGAHSPSAEVGEAIEPAMVVSRVEPTYPEPARRAGLEGLVELEIVVGADGSVQSVEVVRGLPLGLSESAASAVGRWKYRPARSKSGPVASRKTVRILFTLGH